MLNRYILQTYEITWKDDTKSTHRLENAHVRNLKILPCVKVIERLR